MVSGYANLVRNQPLKPSDFPTLSWVGNEYHTGSRGNAV